MVPAAGRINDQGEVIDDDGNPIGKVTDGEASRFSGFIVTQEGDILDEDGGIVGKAEPLDDVASDLNYTTKSAKDDATGEKDQEDQEDQEGQQDQQGESGGGGIGGALGGIANTAGSTVSGVTSGVGKTAKGVTGAVGDTAKGASDAASDATGARDTTSAVGDSVKGATDTAGDAVEGVTGSAGDAAESTTDTSGDATETTGDAAEGAKDTAGDAVEGVKDTAGDAAEDVKDTAGSATKSAKDTASNAAESIKDTTSDAAPGVKDTTGDAADNAGDAAEDIKEDAGSTAETTKDTAGDVAEGVKDTAKDAGGSATGGAGEAAEGVSQGAEDAAEGAPSAGDLGSKAQGLSEQEPVPMDIPSLSPSVAQKIAAMFDGPFTIADGGKVIDQSGKVLGKLAAGSDIQDLIGKEVRGIDEKGNLLGENDTVIGKVDIAPEGSMVQRIKEEVPQAADRLDALEEEAKQQAAPIEIPSFAPSVAGKVIAMFEGPFKIAEDGQVTDQNGKILGKLAEGQDFENLIGKDIKAIDEKGNLLGDNDTALGKVELVPEGTIVERIKDEIPEAAERLDAIEAAKQQAEAADLPNISILEGLKINKMGNIVDDKGNLVGKVKSGDLKKLVGKVADKNGKVWDNRGNVIGEVEVLPEPEQDQSGPFEDFPDATVDKFGKVIFDGRQVGVVVGDDFQKLIGKKVDPDGDILDKNGNVIGHAERKEADEPVEPEEEQIDYSMLRDKKVNKLGNVVDDKGQVWGHVVQGIVKNLAGKRVGENGQIFNDAGKVIGKAEPLPDSEREETKEPAPFEDFPDAVVGDDGAVMFHDERIGTVVEGDAKKLKGKTVDADGDILDRAGNKLGHAERWEPEAAEPEPEIDMSPLAGKRINKAGNAVDKHGDIYGRVIEGSLSRLVGKMCDKKGFVRNEAGDVIGKCELIPEGEREGMKEGPFSELSGCTVNKEGKVVTAGGDVVGRLVSGDPKVLAGRPVDDDGDICDKNGNVMGHAERWEEPEVQKDVSPMSGRKVNKEGNVVDENGDLIGKLTSGDLSKCAGKKIDDDGDVVDQKGAILGHVSLLEDIPEPEPEPEPEAEPEPEPEGETEEEKEARLKIEQDRKIAQQISFCLEQSLDKIKPICRMIAEVS
jgi:hypothetical protein